jgi:hypothetical protein
MADDKELLFLSHPRIMVCEWIPFGTSNLKALNDNLGSFKRIKNALFTHSVKEMDEETSSIEEQEFTKVFVKDYDQTDYVMFEAEIHFLAEEEDVVQEENFGCYVNHSGKVVYGLELLNAERQTADGISVDNISGILADIWEDSSRMMGALITPYQQSLLDLVFRGNARNRDKFNMVIADGVGLVQNGQRIELIPPGKRLNEKELEDWSNEITSNLLDGEKVEAELRQIIDVVQDVQVLSAGSFVIQGNHGVVFIMGPMMNVEEAISYWLFLNSAAVFLENLYHRLFIINADVIEIQDMMQDLERDPNSVETTQKMLVTNSSDTSFIDEIVITLEDAVRREEGHFNDLMASWNDASHNPSTPPGDEVRSADNMDFAEVMGIKKMFDNTGARISDMRNNVYGTQMRLKGLRDNVNATSERRMHQVQMELQENSRALEDITRTNERTGSSLQVLELILAAALAFELLGMTFGEWSAQVYLDETGAWVYLTRPGVMLAIAVLGWILLALLLIRKVKGSEQEAREYLTCRITYNVNCDIDNMKRLINGKRADNELVDLDGDISAQGRRVKASWRSTDPKWRWPIETSFRERLFRKVKETEVTLVYDARNGYLLHALVEVPSPPDEKSIDDLERLLSKELMNGGVIEKGIGVQRPTISST